jgi:outer membrane protein OmpA-like peptidoglycan-associated protein
MEFNVIDQAKSFVTPEIVEKLSAWTREPPENTSRAIHGAFPTLLAGLGQRASTPDGASSILDTLKGAFGGPSQAPTGGRSPEAELQEGYRVVRKIFGERSTQATEALAAHSGVKNSSASHILALAAPLVVGLLGREMASGGTTGLVQKLASNKNAILDDPNTPSRLRAVLGSRGRVRSENLHRDEEAWRTDEPQRFGAHEPRRGPQWGLILGLGAVALAAWGIFGVTRGHVAERGVTERQPTMSAPSIELPPAPAPAASGPGATTQLPNGKTLSLEPGSPEAEFADTLGDSTAPLPRKFQLDSLRFETGSATLPESASTTIDSLASALVAYPSARVRIDGYTDNAGEDSVNRTLSWARANSIKSALVQRGVSADRMDSTGDGSRREVAPNDSNRGRMLNRRSEVTLLNR